MNLNKKRIEEIMSEKGISSKTELAKRMDITKNQLSVLLSDKFNPVKSTVAKLSEILEVDIIEIVQDKSAKQLTLFGEEEPLESTSEDTTGDFIDTSSVVANKDYTVLELFAGAGGLALGLKKAGFDSVGLVEINKYACQTLRENWKSANVIEEDVVKVAEEGIYNYLPKNCPEIDLLAFGFPCQSFSYAGKKLGIEDTRGTMFYYSAKILEQTKPKIFLAENVRGLVSHDQGKTLETILEVFKDIGYKVKYRVLKAVDYGVAQKRERIIIIGIREDLEIEYKYPKIYERKYVLRDVLQNVPDSPGSKYPESKKKVLDLVPPGGYWRDLPPEIAKEFMGKSYYSGGGRTGMARRISWDEPSLTLTCSPAQKQTERCHPDETRPFTTREYARIQCFPDDWEFTGSVSQVYKQIGNAVPVELAKAVGLSIVDVLNRLNEQAINKSEEAVMI